MAAPAGQGRAGLGRAVCAGLAGQDVYCSEWLVVGLVGLPWLVWACYTCEAGQGWAGLAGQGMAGQGKLGRAGQCRLGKAGLGWRGWQGSEGQARQDPHTSDLRDSTCQDAWCHAAGCWLLLLVVNMKNISAAILKMDTSRCLVSCCWLLAVAAGCKTSLENCKTSRARFGKPLGLFGKTSRGANPVTSPSRRPAINTLSGCFI